MAGEGCVICGATVPFSSTVHVLINTKTEDGVLDYYICEDCYTEKLAPHFDVSE